MVDFLWFAVLDIADLFLSIEHNNIFVGWNQDLNFSWKTIFHANFNMSIFFLFLIFYIIVISKFISLTQITLKDGLEFCPLHFLNVNFISPSESTIPGIMYRKSYLGLYLYYSSSLMMHIWVTKIQTVSKGPVKDKLLIMICIVMCCNVPLKIIGLKVVALTLIINYNQKDFQNSWKALIKGTINDIYKIFRNLRNLRTILLEKFLLGSRKGHNVPHSFFSPSPLLHQEKRVPIDCLNLNFLLN